MKSYVKPKLTALSLSGNETLCTGCADKDMMFKDIPWQSLPDFLKDLDKDGNQYLSESELVNTFGSVEGCGTEYLYCKFSSIVTVLWS